MSFIDRIDLRSMVHETDVASFLEGLDGHVNALESTALVLLSTATPSDVNFSVYRWMLSRIEMSRVLGYRVKASLSREQQWKDELAAGAKALDDLIAATPRLVEENDQLVSEVRALRKQLDPETRRRELADARSEGRSEMLLEMAAAKKEADRLRADIADLKASKRRLREALERQAQSKSSRRP